MVQICERQRTKFHRLNPAKVEPNESLPEKNSRNYVGFFITDFQREIQVDQAIVQQEMEYLQNFRVMAYFISKRPPALQLQQWGICYNVRYKG
jgi:hypothetical protein